jgi:hypothetical protein
MRIIKKIVVPPTIWALMLALTVCAAQAVTIMCADYGVEGNRVDVTARVLSMVQNGYLNFRVTNYDLGGDPAPEQIKEFRIRARDSRGYIQDYNFREKDTVNLEVSNGGQNFPPTRAGGGFSQWQGRLSPDDQERFDNYYTRWLTYRSENNQGEVLSMQNRMLEVYNHYDIPGSVPFNQVASPNVAQTDIGPTKSYSDLRILQATYGTPAHSINVSTRLQAMVSNGNLSLHVNNDSMGSDPAPGKHKDLVLVYSLRGQRRNVTVPESEDLRIP